MYILRFALDRGVGTGLNSSSASCNFADSPVVVEIKLGDEDLTAVQGTVTFTSTNTLDPLRGSERPFWAGSLNLTGETGEGTATITGTFDHFNPY